tara:strand:- start:1710 stop:1889 length:180 start_codon:yes stop_codon:yes gene_type:complete
MNRLRKIGLRFSVAGELFKFLWKRKLWWLFPLVFLVVLIGLIIAFGTATGIGPFIYTVF